MPLPVASHILRRLRNSIYSFRVSTEETNETTTFDGPTTIIGPEMESALDNHSLVSNNFNYSGRANMNTSSSSLTEGPSAYVVSPPRAPSPSQENVPPRQIQDSNTRHGQSSNPLICTPDLNAQAVLRKRILEIQSLNLPERDKARRVQALMTEAYLDAQRRRHGSHSEQLHQGELTEKDKDKTYYDEAHGILGCQHYRRGAKLQCSTCNNWATCRYCHDDQEDHKLNRKETRNMICMHCTTPQPAGQNCQNCHIRLARYYCDKCHLWDDSPTKSIYHCADCGICRVGEGLGKDFFHCKTCNVCMSIALQGSHRCVERNTECDCPICGDYLFTSPETVVFMPCGHSIHQKCYNEHLKSSYRCPTCSRALGNMDHYFRLLDVEVQRQPMPAPYNTWQTVILCNDCSAKSCVSFHFVGHKCNLCSSYNTVMCDILKPPEHLPTAQSQSSETGLVSAGLEPAASVTSIMESSPFSEASESTWIAPDRSYLN